MKGVNSFNLVYFERCSGRLADLRFDSDLLESYYSQCAFNQSFNRFVTALSYLTLAILSYFAFYHVFNPGNVISSYSIMMFISIILILVCFAITWIIKKKKANRIQTCYLITGIFISLFYLILFLEKNPLMTIPFNFSLAIQIVVNIYALFPLRLWQSMLITIPLSILNILLNIFLYDLKEYQNIFVLIFGHICIHIIGFILLLMSQVRRRSTFLRLGHSCLMRQELKKEQKIRDDMICSLMPKKLADEVWRDQNKDENNKVEKTNQEQIQHGKKKNRRCIASLIGNNKGVHNHSDQDTIDYLDSDEDDYSSQDRKMSVVKNGENGELEAVDLSIVPSNEQAVKFRQFHVDLMENVSILFADIVGFTKMSSNKSASHLVYLLNDLFGRFDRLCEKIGCEKIATLGDCYYCVCGCPEAKADHAERTVEMGRSMCVAIQQFDRDHSEEVNMRVGVHTGKVLSGIVGTKRFKFDVWSHDVTLANEMESSGKAGTVHISEATLAFVKDVYEVDNGDDLEDIRKVKVLVEFFDKEEQCYAIKHTKDEGMIKTYFVKRRFDDKPPYELPSEPLDPIENIQKPAENEQADNIKSIPETQPLNTKVDTNFKKRNDSDLLIALKEFNSNVDQVFSFPRISKFTLNFSNVYLENAYRCIGMKNIRKNSTITWASPKMTQLINSVAFTVFLVLTLCACLISFTSFWKGETSSVWFIAISIFGLTLTIFILYVIIADFRYCVKTSQISEIKNRSNLSSKIFSKIFKWYPRNIIGALILFLPSALVLSNFDPCIFHSDSVYKCLIGLFFSFMLYSVTLFTMFSFWTKSLTASAIAILSTVLLFNSWSCDKILVEKNIEISKNSTYKNVFGKEGIVFEYLLLIIMHSILIWILNREFEVSARNSFEKYTESRQAKNQISREKLQADWLLANIIPSYIMEDLSATQKYSKHIPQAGVLFATIANFSEFYDEQYQGGQEMLRVLNEIFADFEHLLTSKKYKDVEKIKTIGACFMAASGLNIAEREKNKDPNAHLYALMDFASDLIRTLDDFNAQMFSFKFELKIGYNIGEVTAGVIGTTKLLYDIWGDAVNVASRMYSTGQKGKIQVTEDVASMLSSKFKFEYRGEVFVKGKGDMKTYLLVN